DPEAVRIVDGRLWPQHVQVVVQFDRVVVDPVLDPRPLKLPFQIRVHRRPVSQQATAATQKAQYLGTVKVQKRMPYPTSIELFQILPRAEGHVRCPFALKDRPVVGHWELPQMPRM